ncbi:MAG: class I SAM-dependent methyltransferase [Bacteroidetes bacterium SW_9_63_38]|nr:MAG: class I SAM-dependent methyltransferase [Bacteroidetes bacterium SW_9_63_38]
MSLSQKLFAHGLALGDRVQHRLYGARKRALFADVEGTVVEIGPGTGVNLPYFPEGLRWIGLEPNPHMHPFLRTQLAGRGIDADVRTAPAQDTELPSNSADVVISTLVLCSVPDLGETLAELRRVLRPGGRLLFIEHMAAPRDTWLYTLQRGIRPVWKRLADGCHPDRETGAVLEAAGFSAVTYESFETGLPVVSPHIMGTAVA